MRISLFTSAMDNRPKSLTVSWSDLVSSLSEPVYTSCGLSCPKGNKCEEKSKGRLFSPVTYKEGTTRGKANVQSASCLVYDLDHITTERLQQIQIPHESFTYSTHSDDPQSDDRCFRLLVNINRQVSPLEWAALWVEYAKHYRIPFDESTKDISRIYYEPSTPQGKEFLCFSQEGTPVDVDEFLISVSRVKTPMPQVSTVTGVDAGRNVITPTTAPVTSSLSYDEFLSRVKKLQKKKEESILSRDYELSKYLQRALDGDALPDEGQSRDAALLKVVGCLLGTFGPLYEDSIRFLLRPSCIAMGEDRPGKTYLNILDDKISRDLPEVTRRFEEREAQYKKFLEDRVGEIEESTGDDIIDTINKEFFLAWNASGTECLYWYETPEKIEPISDGSLVKSTNKYKKTMPDGKKIAGLPYWKSHPQAREYKKVLFAPMQQLPPNHYNLFKGYATKPQERDWSRFKEFWLDVVCCNDRSLFEYMFCWCAQLIQRPYVLPGIAMVLYSKTHGTGKNTFTTALGRILGNGLYLSECEYDNVFGKFNGQTERALLINVNEAEGSPNRKMRDAIKHAITEPEKGIEHKGFQRYQVRNYTRYILSSNNLDSVHIDPTDRRMLCVSPHDGKAGDREYFNAIYQEFDEGGLQGLLYDLLMYDLDTTHIDLREIPNTKARDDMRKASLSDVANYWLFWLDSTETNVFHVVQEFERFKGNYTRWGQTATHFASEILSMCPHAKDEMTQTIGGRVRTLTIDSVDKARQDFERIMKVKPEERKLATQKESEI